MDGEDLELFERSLRHATASGSGEALDTALDDLGWRDALAVDPRAAVGALFEMQGAANATSSALGHVIAGALGEGAPGEGAAPGVGATTRAGAGVVLPAAGGWDAPGEVVGEGLAVRGLGLAGLGEQERALVVARSGDGHVAVTVEVAGLDLRPVRGIDPGMGLVEVVGEPGRVTTRPGPGPTGWDAAVAAGRRALAHELVGASRTMLELARAHALDRVQFGKPIASFQAVRHRLAESLVAIEGADAAVAAAWEDGTPLTAAPAKALAGRGARTVARHCQQVLAGIGFTTEHAFHLHLRRALVLDQLFGNARALTHLIGADLIGARRLPTLLPL